MVSVVGQSETKQYNIAAVDRRESDGGKKKEKHIRIGIGWVHLADWVTRKKSNAFNRSTAPTSSPFLAPEKKKKNKKNAL